MSISHEGLSSCSIVVSLLLQKIVSIPNHNLQMLHCISKQTLGPSGTHIQFHRRQPECGRLLCSVSHGLGKSDNYRSCTRSNCRLLYYSYSVSVSANVRLTSIYRFIYLFIITQCIFWWPQMYSTIALYYYALWKLDYQVVTRILMETFNNILSAETRF